MGEKKFQDYCPVCTSVAVRQHSFNIHPTRKIEDADWRLSEEFFCHCRMRYSKFNGWYTEVACPIAHDLQMKENKNEPDAKPESSSRS